MRPVALCGGHGSILTALWAAGFGLISAAHADCPPALGTHAAASPDGSVAVTWFHPARFADTLIAHKGPFFKGFHVGDGLADPRIAVRLPSGMAGEMIYMASAYFLARQGTSGGDWSAKASFDWAVYSDSSDFPGHTVMGEVACPLGSDPNLILGNWWDQIIGWRIPDSLTGSLWLVGHWPASADSVALIGSDNSGTSLPTMVGYIDPGSGPVWDSLTQTGLLVRVIMLRDRRNGAKDIAYHVPPSFRIIGTTISGPDSLHSDTTVGDFASQFLWIDSTVSSGQTREYGVMAVCDGDTGPVNTSPLVAIPAHWPISIAPAAIDAFLLAGSDSIFHLSARNDGADTVSVLVDPSITLNPILLDKSYGSTLTLTVSVDPHDFILPPGSVQKLHLYLSPHPLPLGTFSGRLPIEVIKTGDSAKDRHFVRIVLRVDQTLGVPDPRGNSPTDHSRWPGIMVRQLAGQNGGDVQVSVEFPQPGPTDSTRWGGFLEAPQVPVAVWISDLLGRTIYETKISYLLRAESQVPTISISGSARWPSGVYFCRVRQGSVSGTAPILHLK